ncbi:MAG: hypothetical protein HXY26_00710 [Hydrogenophilaceae bacterium]|nr:hypothetical protein [Hydrogenophilaceae bacterium]
MLHLIIPELLSAESDLSLTPALRALLARGQADPSPAACLPQALCRAIGVDACPIAALSLLDDGGDAGNAYWLRADPVYLHLNIDQLVLTDPRGLGLSQAEAETLTTTLNGHFLPDGLEFLPLAPDRWYLKLGQAPAMQTTPLSEVIGQGIHPHLPQGADARRWRSVINEAQMLLHDHPINQAREGRGLAPINSIWLWGGGSLSALGKLRSARIYGAALAEAADAVATRSEPASLAELGPGVAETVVILKGLQGLNGSARAAALARYETRWFAPALAALKQGRLACLRLYTTGSLPTTRTVRPRDAWKLWRRRP